MMPESQRFIACSLDALLGEEPAEEMPAFAASEPGAGAWDASNTLAFEDLGLESHGEDLGDLASTPEPGFVAMPEVGCYVFDVPDPTYAAQAAQTLGGGFAIVPDIELSLPPTELGSRLAPEEVKPVGEVLPGVSGVQTSHAAGNRGDGAVVAVLDTGCDADHAEFEDRIVDFLWVPLAPGGARSVRGFDPGSHGTHVCGIVAGARTGIAPEAELLVASVLEGNLTTTNLSRILQALNWVLRRIREPRFEQKAVILNLSLGFTSEHLDKPRQQGLMLTIRALLANLANQGVLPIVAIGNEGAGTMRAPGYYPEALSVGAIDYELKPWTKSGGGNAPEPWQEEVKPQIVGFGVDVVSSRERRIDGTSVYATDSGTSMATPYVAGIAALVATKEKISGAELRDRLLETALEVDQPADRVGKGLARYAL